MFQESLEYKGAEVALSQQSSPLLTTSLQVGRSRMVCSNCAVYEPLMSHRGGYGSTMPRSHRFFSAIRYLLSPRRSSHRRQKARVPKFSLITFSKCFALGSLEEKKPNKNLFEKKEVSSASIHYRNKTHQLRVRLDCKVFSDCLDLGCLSISIRCSLQKIKCILLLQIDILQNRL